MNIHILEKNAKNSEYHDERILMSDFAFIWVEDNQLKVLKSRFTSEDGGYDKGMIISPIDMMRNISFYHEMQIKQEADKLALYNAK